MPTTTLIQFFTGKTLEVPDFQRDYAWNTGNVDDLFEDIQEAMEGGEGHYLGTFILSVGDTKDRFKVLDGQQRLTTLTMLLDAMVDALQDGDLKTFYRTTLLHHPIDGPKFSLLGSNQEFFADLLNDANPKPASEGQKRMKAAYDWIQYRVHEIPSTGSGATIADWLSSIGKLEVLEFIEPNEGKAIRMFQSVNDRGVPLSRMDIAKSLLIYYSNRFLGGRLDKSIAEKFGTAFRDYSIIKGQAAEDGYKVRLIDREAFREDDVFRYHYFAFRAADPAIEIPLDFNATSDTVLDDFLKPTLKKLHNDQTRLAAFIENYAEDLAGFFGAFRFLLEATRKDKALYLLFVTGDLAATLYPLTIRLAMRDALRHQPSSAGGRSLLQLLEITDLRVFKIRGTNPRADIASLTRDAGEKPLEEIAEDLRRFVAKFMNDGLFESWLSQEDLYRNLGLSRILLAKEEVERRKGFALAELVEQARQGQTIEHILPQEPSFGVKAYGFASKDAYEDDIHRLGNLTLLESPLNTLCGNKSVDVKMTQENLYRTSRYQITKSLAARYAPRTPAFKRSDIEERGAELANFCVAKWPLW